MHEGEQFQKVITLNNVVKTKFAKSMGVHRNTIEHVVKSENVPVKYKLALAGYIGRDISNYFPELREIPNYYEQIGLDPAMVEDSKSPYNARLTEVERKIEELDNKLKRADEDHVQKQRMIDYLLRNVEEKDKEIERLKELLKNRDSE